MTVGARRFANWVNDAVLFNATAANGGVITAAVADAGVGISATEANVYAVTVGGVVITTAAPLAESIVNSTYSATATATDKLGNTSAASAAATFGVDRTIPTFTFGGPADQAVIGAPNATLLGPVTYLDPATAPAGPSTPSATPVRYTIQRRTTATASKLWDNTLAVFASTGATFSAGLAGVNLEPAGATNVEAYYVVTELVEDGAGNQSVAVTRTYLRDVTVPTGPFSIPVMTASAGASNLFTSSMTDNLDIASSQWSMGYNVLGTTAPGAAGASILLPATTVGSFLSFTTTATDGANYPLFRSMTDVAAGVPTFANQGSLLTVAHTTTDQAALFTAVGNTIPAANLPALAATNPYATANFAGTGFSRQA